MNTLMMADAPAKPSAPLPAFDLPVSAVKLPPAPMSESDVAKTAVFKSVNASDVDLPDDYRPAGKKGRPALLVGLGIAAVVAVLAGAAVALRGSPEEPKAPATVAAPPPKTADIPPVEPATASPAAPTKAIATAAAKPAPAPPHAPEPVAAKPAPPPAAAKPAAPPAAAKPAAPPAKPAAPPAPAKPATKGGIVRDAPF
ncbi:MAG: hypothetical protein IPF92_10350 [Myxococcales bacterium]|nr:hypothetical protein [Myxococcales bacterium]